MLAPPPRFPGRGWVSSITARHTYMSDPPSASPSEAPADPAPESAAPPEPNSANSAATPPPEPSPPSKPADEEAELKMAAFEVEAEVALLMDANAATERSGVALTNWAKFARPAELVVLAVVMIMLLVAKGGNDWARVGAGTAGLSTARVSGSEAYAPLSSQCATADAATAACALASAGSWASGLSSLALLAGVLLGTATVLQLLHQRGLLGAVAAKLKDPQRFERGLRLAPVALWSVLLLLLFVALLVYAVLARNAAHTPRHCGDPSACTSTLPSPAHRLFAALATQASAVLPRSLHPRPPPTSTAACTSASLTAPPASRCCSARAAPRSTSPSSTGWPRTRCAGSS